MTEVNSFYARVVADGGTISDFSALRLAVVDYKAVQSLEPSLYTFASGRKAGTQYSLVPADGSGDLSVTRSGDTAMELNANGFWQPVAANLPRYDYVWGRPMLNVEELRTNLLPRYKTFAHSDWLKSGASIQGDPSTAGAELITNGGFDSTANWTAESGVTFTTADGIATIISNGSFTGINQLTTLTIGKLYKIEIRHKNAAAFRVYAGNQGFETIAIAADYTTSIVYVLAVGTLTRVYILPANAAQTIYVDSISVKEVTGYASPFVDSAGANLMDGYKLVEGTNNGSHYVYRVTAVTAGTNSVSFFAKPVERSVIRLVDTTYSGKNTYIDLINKTYTGTDITVKFTDSVDGWVRIEATLVTFSGLDLGIYLAASTSSSSYLGDGTSGVLIAHAQLEAGATASSPIGGAEGSIQTRNADIIEKAVFPNIFGDEEGFILFSTNQENIEVCGLIAIGLSIGDKVLFNYSSSEIELWANGVMLDSESGNYEWSALSEVSLTIGNDAANYLNGIINLLVSGKTKLNALQAQNITT